MYSPVNIEEQKYIIKPMNCPGHILVYKSKTRSYRDLPLRWAELGTVYRYEKSGVLHGLMRVRGFTQDDAHIFCRPEQLTEELENVIRLAISILKKFGFVDYEIYLSTQPTDFVGTQNHWDKATQALKDALERQGLKYEVDPGQGVFYGPKIDIKIKDCLGRAWQCSTIQVDFNLPERFKLEFVDDKGKTQTPIMVHRAILGSLERFFGVLIEHYKGAFPLWLAPVQVAVIPIKTDQVGYAEKIEQRLNESGLRVKLDARNETLNKRIREAEIEKISYLVIIGEKEVASSLISVRKRGEGDKGKVSVEEFIKKIIEEVK
jgi:threonyl-tRNA synthetase